MRKTIASVLGVVCLTVALGAQAKPTTQVEKKATDNLWIDKDVKVGGQLIKAGEYKVTSAAGTVTFVRLRESQDPGMWLVSQEKAIEVASKSTAMPKKAEGTETHTVAGPDGGLVLQTLTVAGSAFQHEFN